MIRLCLEAFLKGEVHLTILIRCQFNGPLSRHQHKVQLIGQTTNLLHCGAAGAILDIELLTSRAADVPADFLLET